MLFSHIFPPCKRHVIHEQISSIKTLGLCLIRILLLVFLKNIINLSPQNLFLLWKFRICFLVPKIQIIFQNSFIWLFPLSSGLTPLFYCTVFIYRFFFFLPLSIPVLCLISGRYIHSAAAWLLPTFVF